MKIDSVQDEEIITQNQKDALVTQEFLQFLRVTSEYLRRQRQEIESLLPRF